MTGVLLYLVALKHLYCSVPDITVFPYLAAAASCEIACLVAVLPLDLTANLSLHIRVAGCVYVLTNVYTNLIVLSAYVLLLLLAIGVCYSHYCPWRFTFLAAVLARNHILVARFIISSLSESTVADSSAAEE